MTLHFGLPEVQAQIRRELARIGVDGPAALGMAASGPVTPEEFLAALARTPDGAGAEAMVAEIRRCLAAETGGGPEPTGTWR